MAALAPDSTPLRTWLSDLGLEELHDDIKDLGFHELKDLSGFGERDIDALFDGLGGKLPLPRRGRLRTAIASMQEDYDDDVAAFDKAEASELFSSRMVCLIFSSKDEEDTRKDIMAFLRKTLNARASYVIMQRLRSLRAYRVGVYFVHLGRYGLPEHDLEERLEAAMAGFGHRSCAVESSHLDQEDFSVRYRRNPMLSWNLPQGLAIGNYVKVRIDGVGERVGQVKATSMIGDVQYVGVRLVRPVYYEAGMPSSASSNILDDASNKPITVADQSSDDPLNPHNHFLCPPGYGLMIELGKIEVLDGLGDDMSDSPDLRGDIQALRDNNDFSRDYKRDMVLAQLQEQMHETLSELDFYRAMSGRNQLDETQLRRIYHNIDLRNSHKIGAAEMEAWLRGQIRPPTREKGVRNPNREEFESFVDAHLLLLRRVQSQLQQYQISIVQFCLAMQCGGFLEADELRQLFKAIDVERQGNIDSAAIEAWRSRCFHHPPPCDNPRAITEVPAVIWSRIFSFAPAKLVDLATLFLEGSSGMMGNDGVVTPHPLSRNSSLNNSLVYAVLSAWSLDSVVSAARQTEQPDLDYFNPPYDESYCIFVVGGGCYVEKYRTLWALARNRAKTQHMFCGLVPRGLTRLNGRVAVRVYLIVQGCGPLIVPACREIVDTMMISVDDEDDRKAHDGDDRRDDGSRIEQVFAKFAPLLDHDICVAVSEKTVSNFANDEAERRSLEEMLRVHRQRDELTAHELWDLMSFPMRVPQSMEFERLVENRSASLTPSFGSR